MIKIGVIHATVSSVAPLEEALKPFGPEFQYIHLVDEYMLKRIRSEGGVSFQAKREFMKLVFRLLEANPDALLIACTVYGHLASVIQTFTDIPVLAVDLPMLEKAAQTGLRIGVLATNQEAGIRAEEELSRLGKEQSIAIPVEVLVLPEAFQKLQQGKCEEHDRILKEGAKVLAANGAQVLVLAQLTMARTAALLEEDSIMVLSSPGEAIFRVQELLGGSS